MNLEFTFISLSLRLYMVGGYYFLFFIRKKVRDVIWVRSIYSVECFPIVLDGGQEAWNHCDYSAICWPIDVNLPFVSQAKHRFFHSAN